MLFFVCVSSEGYGQTANLWRLVWAFVDGIYEPWHVISNNVAFWQV